MAFELKMNIDNVKDDENELMDPRFVDDRQKGFILEVDWEKDEEDQIQTRTFPVIRRTERWLREQIMGKGYKKGSTSSSEVPLDASYVTSCVEGSSIT